eukprot:3138893-Amphidinium_carterae.1
MKITLHNPFIKELINVKLHEQLEFLRDFMKLLSGARRAHECTSCYLGIERDGSTIFEVLGQCGKYSEETRVERERLPHKRRLHLLQKWICRIQRLDLPPPNVERDGPAWWSNSQPVVF